MLPGRRAFLTEITPADPLADYSRLARRGLRTPVLDRRECLSNHFTWVVVADEHRATIYAVPRGMVRLREIFELPRSGDTGDFVAELTRYLEEARAEGRYDELVLVAAPAFLAVLRARLSDAARDALVGEIGRNLVGAGREILQEEVLRVL